MQSRYVVSRLQKKTLILISSDSPSAPPCYGSYWVDGENGSLSSVWAEREDRKRTPPAWEKMTHGRTYLEMLINSKYSLNSTCTSKSLPLSRQCTGDSVDLWMSPLSETCSWWTAESAAAHPEGSLPSSPLPPEQKTPETQTQWSRETPGQQFSKLIIFSYWIVIHWEYHICLQYGLYHGASLDYRKDAPQDPRTDKQLPLLAQMQVDVMQNHRKQNTARLWGKKEGKRKKVNERGQRNTLSLSKNLHLSHRGRRRGGSQLYEQWIAVWLHP